MSQITLLLVFVAVGLLTFLMRFSFIGMAGRINMPGWLTRGLKFVPPAVLSAIIWPELLLREGAITIGPDNHRLLAGLIAIVAALISKNIFATLGIGMTSLYLLDWLLR